tara:strand:- start:3534 stop:4652 length:1119 start_codon:yes stop_codon:yes gene_type:complete
MIFIIELESNLNSIFNEDLENIHCAIKKHRDKFRNSNFLITGCAGFLGFYLINYLLRYSDELEINLILGVDNFILGRPKWLDELQQKYEKKFSIKNIDICDLNLSEIFEAKSINYVIHAASIASPTFYRKYPLKTIEGNIWGLKNLLNFYKNKDLKGFLFFSSSEVYGDPSPENIPTSEDYRGNVSMVGPRACYDESKRFGETLCYVYNLQYKIPITIARPFNNYGPGMNVNDKRVPADFAKSIIKRENIVLLSDGSPTRTFCYISDAITGYLLCLLYGSFEIFNIGTEKPEISILKLAQIYQSVSAKILNFIPDVIHEKSSDKEYMMDNPNRRCPIIEKAKLKLNYNPKVDIENGIERYLTYLSLDNEKNK